MANLFFYETVIGTIGITDNGSAITHLFFASEATSPDARLAETPLAKEVALQLTEYFSGTRKSFTLPLAPAGTPFQQRVWQALQQIPYGETRSYKEIASSIGQPAACRAVGMANNKNPLAILIPCHRVIGANGKLVGYAGGLNLKETLLSLERQHAAKGATS